MADRFLCCDWGTSRFRLRLLDTSAAVLAEIETDQGVAACAQGGEARFQATLLDSVQTVLRAAPAGQSPKRLIASGMISSSIGWRELPYASLPFPLDGSAVVSSDLPPLPLNPPIPVTLVSGVCSGADVLRGEETELIGLLRGRSLEARTVVLPGTHSKHLHVSGGQLRDFRTFLTGELFSLLATHGILRHSIQPGAPDLTNPKEADAFRDGLQFGSALPLTHALFRIRTASLLQNASPESGRARLSGILTGAEVSALREFHPDGDTPILIAAAPSLAPAYRIAAAFFELNVEWVAPRDAALASALGQLVLYTTLCSDRGPAASPHRSSRFIKRNSRQPASQQDPSTPDKD